MINTDNVFLLIVAFELVFLGIMLAGRKTRGYFERTYSFMVFNAVSLALILIGAGALFVDRGSVSLRILFHAPFNPAMLLVLVAILLKVGLFPLHRKVFDVITGSGYHVICIYVIFWVPAVIFSVLKLCESMSLIKTGFLYGLMLLYVVTPNIVAFKLRKKKISVPLVLLSCFLSVLFLQGYPAGKEIFFSSYFDYILISFVVLLVLSKNKKGEILESGRIESVFYIFLLAAATGIGFSHGFWTFLSVCSYLFESALPLIIVGLVMNTFLGLYNLGVNSLHIIRMGPERSDTCILLCLVAIFIIAGALFPEEIGAVPNILLRG